MEVYLACSRSAKRKQEQLEWGEPGGEKQEKRKVKERAGSPMTEPCRPWYSDIPSVRTPQALQQPPTCGSGWESASPLLSWFPTSCGAPKVRVKYPHPCPPEAEFLPFLLPKMSLSIGAHK